MEKDNNNLTYDQAIQKAQAIVNELEQVQALSMEDYKQRSKEVKLLLDYCEQQLKNIERDLFV